MKKYNLELDKQIIKILKKYKRYGLTRPQICKWLKLKTYIYKANIILPSGIYYQERELHYKRTTIYEHLEKLLNQGILEKYSLIDGSKGKPNVCWKLK